MITDLKKNNVIRHRKEEAMTSNVIDLIMAHRLNHLANEDTYESLMLSAEVLVSIKATSILGTKPYWFDI